jgi:hypothetical protein
VVQFCDQCTDFRPEDYGHYYIWEEHRRLFG